MATEIEIDTIINTDRSDDGIRQLRTGLKDLISLQTQVGKNSDQFTQLQKAIGDTETKIRTLNDGFGTLRGSGVDRLTNSIGLLKEGFSAADPEKLSIGMEGLGAAMKAIPIFLLIEGAKLLFDNFGKIVDMFSSSAIQARVNAEELRQLTNQVDQNRISIERNIISRESELTQLKLYGAGYETIISKIKEINALKQDDFRAELQKSDKSIQNQIDVVKNLKDEIDNQTETSSLLEFLGIGGDPKEELKKAEDELNKLMIARGATDNAKIKAAVDTTNEIDTINKEAYDKLKQKYADDATEFNRLLGLKQEYSEALNAARIQDEENANAKLIKAYQDEKNAEQYLNDAFAQQDADANKDNDSKQIIKNKNELAFSQAFQQQSLQQKIEFINQDRDTQLLNEDLTQKQRIAIIEKSENDILQLKVKKGEEYVSYAKAGVEILNGLNQYETQSQNYELQQQEYAKDAAIQNDTNRTQEKINADKSYTDQQLSNDSLSSDQRNQITQNSENRQQKITADSKNAQLAIANDFSKKEIQIRREQFEKQKAIQIVTGIINTAAAVLQTIATVPYPANIPLAILAGAAGAIQVGIIASQQFDDGGAAANATVAPVSSVSGGSFSGGSGGSGGSSPTFNPQAIGGGFKTDASQTEIEKARQQKVYILESDIRSTMGKVDVYESRATFGG